MSCLCCIINMHKVPFSRRMAHKNACFFFIIFCSKMCQFSKPEDLKKLLAPILKIDTEGGSTDQLLAACSQFIKHSVKTSEGAIKFIPQKIIVQILYRELGRRELVIKFKWAGKRYFWGWGRDTSGAGRRYF